MSELERQKLIKLEAEANKQRPTLMIRQEEGPRRPRRLESLPQIAGGGAASRPDESLYSAGRAFVSTCLVENRFNLTKSRT